MSETTQPTTRANALQVKKYFGYNGEGSAKAFSEEWKRCTADDQKEICEGVGAEIDAGRFQP